MGNTVVPTFLSDKEVTIVWYIWHGHMRENGMTKLSRRGFTKRRQSTKKTLDYIHFDIWGLVMVSSKGGAYYLLTIIDNFFKRLWIFFLK